MIREGEREKGNPGRTILSPSFQVGGDGRDERDERALHRVPSAFCPPAEGTTKYAFGFYRENLRWQAGWMEKGPWERVSERGEREPPRGK